MLREPILTFAKCMSLHVLQLVFGKDDAAQSTIEATKAAAALHIQSERIRTTWQPLIDTTFLNSPAHINIVLMSTDSAFVAYLARSKPPKANLAY